MKEKLRQQARGQAREKAEAYLKDLSIEEQAMLLKYESPAIPKAGIPEYNWWNEALHGVARAGTATVFPVPIAMAASFDEELVKEIGDCISTEGEQNITDSSGRRTMTFIKALPIGLPISIFFVIPDGEEVMRPLEKIPI